MNDINPPGIMYGHLHVGMILPGATACQGYRPPSRPRKGGRAWASAARGGTRTPAPSTTTTTPADTSSLFHLTMENTKFMAYIYVV